MDILNNKLNKKTFLELNAEDAKVLAGFIESMPGFESRNPIKETLASIGDNETVESRPWFVPYLMLTEYANVLPISSEVQEYLVKNPIYPEELRLNQVTEPARFSSDDSKNDPLEAIEQSPTSTSHPTQQSLESEVQPSNIVSEQNDVPQNITKIPDDTIVVHGDGKSKKDLSKVQQKVVKHVRIKSPPDTNDTCPTTTAPPSRLPSEKDQSTKPVYCFLHVMKFVAKSGTDQEVYFNKVILPFIFNKSAKIKALVSSKHSENKRVRLNEYLDTIMSYDGGVMLREIGYEMIGTVLRSVSAKFGERRLQQIIQLTLHNCGNGEKSLGQTYLNFFPNNPRKLDRMLGYLKKEITKMT